MGVNKNHVRQLQEPARGRIQGVATLRSVPSSADHRSPTVLAPLIVLTLLLVTLALPVLGSSLLTTALLLLMKAIRFLTTTLLLGPVLVRATKPIHGVLLEKEPLP